MTAQLQKPLKEQLREALNDISFKKAFKKMASEEVNRSASRKNLLILTLVYGAVMASLIALAI